MWPWRDWVIHAFNKNIPYDQFLTWQIAGDMLPDSSKEKILATGFFRNHKYTEEGGVIPEEYRIEYLLDKTKTYSKGILGITMECAQCHDHKYDPLTQEDYYRIFAYLNDTHEASVAVYAPEEQQKRAEILRLIHELEADLQHRTSDWPQKMTAWEESVRAGQTDWKVVKVANAGDNGQRHPVASGRRVRCGHRDLLHVSIAELARPFNVFAGNDVGCRRRRPRGGSLHVPEAGRSVVSARRLKISRVGAATDERRWPTVGAATGAIRRATFARG